MLRSYVYPKQRSFSTRQRGSRRLCWDLIVRVWELNLKKKKLFCVPKRGVIEIFDIRRKRNYSRINERFQTIHNVIRDCLRR